MSDTRSTNGARRTIDLRSDTVTRPSLEMRRAMAEAEVGDDVLGDDPTVIGLQEHAAALFGKEAALYLPSGTMANQAALYAHTARGEEIFVHEQAHILIYERGGAAVHSALQVRCFRSDDGLLPLDELEEYVHDGSDPHHAPTRLVALENTHNHCGGLILPLEAVRETRSFCDRHSLILHLDGARVCNASVASGVPLTEIVAPYHSVSVCLSKGLGAPVGSLLLGRRDFIARALAARKLMGGGMRQVGIIAAGGLYALRHNIDRLADNHRRCRVLAERLMAAPGLTIDLARVQTNMVFADCRTSGRRAAEVVALLAADGVLAIDEGPYLVRFVTHLDLDDADVEEAAAVTVAGMERIAG
ncbi:MAG TPA: low-specificity L-threonine aldolase [Thermoleophilia bacterium]|nr:low-specificity L-threonine aldolase [Thermoleophilia bacterium]